MLGIQLIGQGAFIVASLALAARLLLRWRQTREVPEFAIGVSFLLGGGLGYLSWFALAVGVLQGFAPAVLHGIVLFGLACTCLGALALGAGLARIYRPSEHWPIPCLGAVALVMLASWFALAASPPGGDGLAFWVGLLAAAPIYAWGALESFMLSRLLARRSRLGLADPLVAHRSAQWGVSCTGVVVMISLSFVSSIVQGPALSEWVVALVAGCGLVSAAAIWLGFFPPLVLRERLARAFQE
jgi:hypothetical protein